MFFKISIDVKRRVAFRKEAEISLGNRADFMVIKKLCGFGVGYYSKIEQVLYNELRRYVDLSFDFIIKRRMQYMRYCDAVVVVVRLKIT